MSKHEHAAHVLLLWLHNIAYVAHNITSHNITSHHTARPRSVQGGSLAQHVVLKGEKKGLKGPQDKSSDAFDKLRRELIFSARGQVSSISAHQTTPAQAHGQRGVQRPGSHISSSVEKLMHAAAPVLCTA